MKNKRRQFIKQTALAGLGVAGGKWLNASTFDHTNFISSNTNMTDKNFDVQHPSVIGLYGPWAASLNENKLPSLSFRRKEFSNIEEWRKLAREASDRKNVNTRYRRHAKSNCEQAIQL